MDSFRHFNSRRDFLTKSAGSIACLLTGVLGISQVSSSNSNDVEGTVPSLSGPLDVKKLGITLMHEHVLHRSIPGTSHEFPDEPGSVPAFAPGGPSFDIISASVNIAEKLLNEAKEAGVDTIVDLTVYRDIKLYQEIAQKTKINIIVATGYYLRNIMPLRLRDLTEAQMEERMYKEVTEGIDGTKIRAGIIKVAAGNYKLTEWEQKVFRAAARVNKATGVPIATHACEGAREQFELLVKSGANPNHLDFAHIESEFGWRGRTREQIAEEFLTIVKEGGYLLFNNFSCEFYTKWENMVYLMRYYCDKGYANRIFMSGDTNWDWKNGKQVFEKEEEYPDARLRTYSHMMTHEVPLLLNSGFTKADINTFLVDNPRNFFTV